MGNDWRYIRLAPAVVAAEAYRQVPDGGCMYGLFAGIMTVMAAKQGEPCLSFPIHMMKYGEGGVGLWGSLCGTVNGGAAIIGLFEQDKQRRENLIAELFSWYETTELPTYQPKERRLRGNSQDRCRLGLVPRIGRQVVQNVWKRDRQPGDERAMPPVDRRRCRKDGGVAQREPARAMQVRRSESRGQVLPLVPQQGTP